MERERGKKREEKRKGGKTFSASASLPSHAIDIRVLWEGGGIRSGVYEPHDLEIKRYDKFYDFSFRWFL